MTPSAKISTFFSRLVLLAVYAAFFAVQLTAHFNHRTGSVYRLNSGLFQSVKAVKQIPQGLSGSDEAARKISIRLNKKFQPQPLILFAVYTAKPRAISYMAHASDHYPDPFISTAFLLNSSLRGPPSCA